MMNRQAGKCYPDTHNTSMTTKKRSSPHRGGTASGRALPVPVDPKAAALYARVSTKEQELGYSISAQQDLLRSYAAERNLVLQEFQDVETAKTTGRPGFQAMVAYLRDHPECRIILVEKTD